LMMTILESVYLERKFMAKLMWKEESRGRS